MKYVLMPIAHGVQFKKIHQDYASPLIERVAALLTDEERGFFVPLPYNYSIGTNTRQSQIFDATDKGLGNERLREIKHSVGSDVTWSFIVAKSQGACFYSEFVNNMSTLIEDARAKYPGHKVLCLGHSQGTQLFYSFFFDYPYVIDAFVSMGSPISMNSGAYEDFGKVPTTLHSWTNFYHPMDFISSRLQGSHPSSAIRDFVVDYEVPLGWNPLYYLNVPFIATDSLFNIRFGAGLMAHVSYWQSAFVTKKIAEIVKTLMHQPT